MLAPITPKDITGSPARQRKAGRMVWNRPLPGATVSVLGGESVLQITTDPMGAFSLSDLAAGRYTASVRSARGDVGVIAPGDFELKNARACMEVEAVVHAAGTVRGRVIDAVRREPCDSCTEDGEVFLARNPASRSIR